MLTELPNSFWEGTGDIPTTITDTDGNTYEVAQVDAEAFDNMTSDIIVVLPEGLTTTEPVTNVVNGDGTCETLDLTDIENFSLPTDVEAENVVYVREVTEETTTQVTENTIPFVKTPDIEFVKLPSEQFADSIEREASEIIDDAIAKAISYVNAMSCPCSR